MLDTNKFYLTTPIYYVNARPHIGHAYTTIAADVIARRHRLLGEDTYFLTGTDEHGQKIERSATAAGIPPQQFTDQVAAQFRGLWDRMGITYDGFIRTTDPHHKQGAQKLFTELYNRGHIYLSTYTGAYCVSDEAFVDLPVGTPCPDCGRILEEVTEENFFFRLSAFQAQLIDLIESGTLVIQPEVRRNEVLSFLRGNVAEAEKETDKETEEVTDNDAVIPSERSESRNPRISSEAPQNSPINQIARSAAGTPYVPGALKDLSISRSSFKWGIPVPAEVQQKAGATQSHIIYVWLDALTNYMSAVGYGSDTPEDIAKFQKYWPADLHLVGKEIIRFHCVYWPAFLMAAGIDVPKAITAHGWLLFEESKMSKSRGNIVRTETILDAFGALCPPLPPQTASESVLLKGTASAVPQTPPSENAALAAEVSTPSKQEQDLFASDVLRYFLLREIPFGQDGSFSFDALVTRYNADLANGYGNLISRTLKLIEQNMPNGIEVPTKPYIFEDQHAYWGDNHPSPDEAISGTRFIGNEILQLTNDWGLLLADSYKFQILLAEFQLRVGHVDRYISFHKPWLLAKADDELSRKKLVETLYTAAESIRIITALLYPFLPYAAAKVWAQLGLGDIEQDARNGNLKDLKWGGLKPGTKLGPLGPIFPRADKGIIEIMNTMEQKPAGLPHVNNSVDNPSREHTEFREAPIASESATPALNPIAETIHPITAAEPETPQIAIDDFAKIDLRVAQIIVAERIPKADKLLRLEVDLGHEKRQILSGIAQWYTPEELLGRKIVIIANLAPRKMRGLESHGMLLAASHGDDGKPVLATFGEDIALGSRLR